MAGNNEEEKRNTRGKQWRWALQQSWELQGEEMQWMTLHGPLIFAVLFFSSHSIQTQAVLSRTLSAFFQNTAVFWPLDPAGMWIPEMLSHITHLWASFSSLLAQTFACFIGISKYLHEAAVILAMANTVTRICSICWGVCFRSCAAVVEWDRAGEERAASSWPSQTAFIAPQKIRVLGLSSMGKWNELSAFMPPLQQCVTPLANSSGGLAGGWKL